MSTELLELADELETVARQFQANHKETLKKLSDAATTIHKSWSGSNLGYHALVYYEGLAERPPGTHFSAEWGLGDQGFNTVGSVGDWREYSARVLHILTEA